MRTASWLLLLFPLLAWSEDLERGRVLYQTHCGGCHYERTHDERVRSYTLDELDDIVQYLNEAHYRFGLAPLAPRRR